MLRPINEIATEIMEDWTHPSPGAAVYLDAMRHLTTMTSQYGGKSADAVVQNFLFNAKGWRGANARRIKEELRSLLA